MDPSQLSKLQKVFLKVKNYYYMYSTPIAHTKQACSGHERKIEGNPDHSDINILEVNEQRQSLENGKRYNHQFYNLCFSLLCESKYGFTDLYKNTSCSWFGCMYFALNSEFYRDKVTARHGMNCYSSG